MTMSETWVNAVWQTLTDQQLRALTPPGFHEVLGSPEADEDVDEAWELFAQRRQEVFGA